MRRFKVGDIIYSAILGRREEKVTCPVCFGELKVTVTLGNGKKVKTPCDYCGMGYKKAKGFIIEYSYIPQARKFTVYKTKIEIDKNGETRTYYSVDPDGYMCSYNGETCFPTEYEALKIAKLMTDQAEEEQYTRARYLKADIYKSYSYNVGYFMEEIEKSKLDIERYEKKLEICKSKEENNATS